MIAQRYQTTGQPTALIASLILDRVPGWQKTDVVCDGGLWAFVSMLGEHRAVDGKRLGCERCVIDRI